MLNILQAQDSEAGAGTERTIDTSRRIRKIENKNGITYKKLNRKMVERLRQELNAIPPDRNDPWDIRLPSSGVTTSCSFLSGSRVTMTGRCTAMGSCRDGNLDYGNNVSIEERGEGRDDLISPQQTDCSGRPGGSGCRIQSPLTEETWGQCNKYGHCIATDRQIVR